jgi:O-antigen/teichoic acid export membrane protein
MVAGGIFLFPSINFLILAIFGTQILAKLGNTLHLWKQRPFLLPSPKMIRRKTGAHLFQDGIAFSASFSVTSIVEFNLCTIIIGWVAGPSEVSLYGVLVTLTISLLGFVMMFTSPLWPSIVDACERNDLDWIRRTARKLYRFAMAYALAVAVGISLLGPFMLPLWLGDEFSNIPVAVLAAFGIYFMAYVWRHANHMLLVGMGKVKAAAGFQITESVAIIGIAWLGMKLFGIAGLLGFMALTIFGITGWIFPRMFARALASRRSEIPGEKRSSPTVAIEANPGLGVESLP